MSIKNELITLKERKTELEKQLATVYLELDELYVKKGSLIEKVVSLSNRTSGLAKELLEKVKSELSSLNQEIVQKQEIQAEVKKEIEEKQRYIFLREEHTGLYIQEQSALIVIKFLSYMNDKRDEIGLEIKRTFHIKEIVKDAGDRLDTCYVPTGNIGIYDESEKTFIATSEDFYFENELFTIEEGRNGMHCNKTEWYKNYYKDFVLSILKNIEENQVYEECFKLTIEDSYFSFELM